MYLPILHLSRIELRCKLQEKLHRVTGPLGSCHLSSRNIACNTTHTSLTAAHEHTVMW